jgi:hypothetical protein
MRWQLLISAIPVLLGIGLASYATTFRVYTDEDATQRIADELAPKLGADGRIQSDTNTAYAEWFSRLHLYETPYKRLSDLGRGLCTAGMGFYLASRLWTRYRQSPSFRTKRKLMLIWNLLWLVRIPLSIGYYTLRAFREDYPWWGDSIGGGIILDSISWIAGALVTSAILMWFLNKRRLPDEILISKPQSIWDWIRTVLLSSWILFLATCLEQGIPDGDEGVVLTSVIAPVILVIVMAAPRKDAIQPTDRVLVS